MYLEHYGLREFPFSLTPDTQYFFEYGHYRDALETLKVALASGEGFIKVSGEVGTGKTLLCRKLLNSLDHKVFYTAYIPNPFLTPAALTVALAEELGLGLAHNLGQHRVVKEVTRRLIQLHAEGKQVVLLIDEAQAMPGDTLEALRLLTNLETEKRKLLQVVLFGQPELDERLGDRSRRQLRQRITFSYRLMPIDRAGMEAYVSHRLLVAGANGNVRFASDALDALHRYSGGIPRLVNILSHKALMAGYGLGQKDVSRQHVDMAAKDTEQVDLRGVAHRQPVWLWIGLILVVLLALMAWLLATGSAEQQAEGAAAATGAAATPAEVVSAGGAGDTNVPEMPTNLAPGGEESPGDVLDSRSVALRWDASAGASRYMLSVRDMISGELVVDTLVADTTYSVQLSGTREYRWNVAACGSDGCSAYTRPLYFRTPVASAMVQE
ncbi:MAG: AAA family ATPase [Pseudomonadota bacterium]